jgi:hypothetical protein
MRIWPPSGSHLPNAMREPLGERSQKVSEGSTSILASSPFLPCKGSKAKNTSWSSLISLRTHWRVEPAREGQRKSGYPLAVGSHRSRGTRAEPGYPFTSSTASGAPPETGARIKRPDGGGWSLCVFGHAKNRIQFPSELNCGALFSSAEPETISSAARLPTPCLKMSKFPPRSEKNSMALLSCIHLPGQSIRSSSVRRTGVLRRDPFPSSSPT